MKCNVGGIDRKIRIILGVVVVLLGTYITDAKDFNTGVVVQVIGAVVFATGIFNFCLAYKFLGINTYKEGESCCGPKTKCCDKESKEKNED